ncbi:hypothetical protein ATANTOWER_018889 [Ataeniobius toweri]|uniref:Uncharacterized protein n=1 Tax=Ataeniobius toweri TaxID=208326 RepID=A0ABU7BZW9_9TELE|nr:hypothetical protein [Ataeniobius toweri]
MPLCVCTKQEEERQDINTTHTHTHTHWTGRDECKIEQPLKSHHTKKIFQSVAAGPSQPRLKVFPHMMQGDMKSCFESDCYKQYLWPEYLEKEDSSYRFACRNFSLPNTRICFHIVVKIQQPVREAFQLLK